MAAKNPHQYFVEEFKKLSLLYKDVKRKIILAEESYDLVPFTLMNEVRASYDHVFRIFLNNKIDDLDEIKTQFISAKRHLKRAGYDACELIVQAYIIKIQKILNAYSLDTLHTVLGDKYIEVKLLIEKIKSNYLVEARSNKNSKIEGEDSATKRLELYPQFTKTIDLIVKQWEMVTTHEPYLLEHKNALKRTKNKRNINSVLGVIVFPVILLLVELKYNFISSESNESDILLKDSVKVETTDSLISPTSFENDDLDAQ